MGAMLKQLWNALSSLFTAAEITGEMMQGFAKAGRSLSEWSEEKAAEFADTAREERRQRLALMKQSFAEKLPAPAQE